jgi:hypothetical protein
MRLRRHVDLDAGLIHIHAPSKDLDDLRDSLSLSLSFKHHYILNMRLRRHEDLDAGIHQAPSKDLGDLQFKILKSVGVPEARTREREIEMHVIKLLPFANPLRKEKYKILSEITLNICSTQTVGRCRGGLSYPNPLSHGLKALEPRPTRGDAKQRPSE